MLLAISVELTDDACSCLRDHHHIMIMSFDTETHLAALISVSREQFAHGQVHVAFSLLRSHARSRGRAGKVVNRRLPRTHRAKFAHFRADFQLHLHWFEWESETNPRIDRHWQPAQKCKFFFSCENLFATFCILNAYFKTLLCEKIRKSKFTTQQQWEPVKKYNTKYNAKKVVTMFIKGFSKWLIVVVL